MHLRALLVTVVVFVPACTSVKSTDIDTSGMSAHMTVTADGQGDTAVSAELNVDTNATDFVDVSSGDSLSAAAGGGPGRSMTRSDLLGVISYGTSFTGEDAPGTAYTIAFSRNAPNVSAPSSTCTIPQPFAITAPASGMSFSRSTDAVLVTYSNGGQSDAMTYLVSGSCVNTAGGTVPADSGSVAIPKGTLVDSAGPSTCMATLTLRRSRTGRLDPAFGYGGSISCDQTRTVTFTSTP
jgi:hypothetical protein